MFVRLASGVIINVDRINHIEPRDPDYATTAHVATCWFYKNVGERLTQDDLENVLEAVSKGPGLL